MPGKKFRAPNTKAEAARERKDATKREAEERKRKEEEDEYWRDDDKHATRKQDRKSEREKKRQEQLDRKAAAKKLLEDEDTKLPGKAAGTGKVTRAQIAESQARQKAQEEASALPKGVSEPIKLDVNPNHLMRERVLEGHVDAETVDEAIAVLSVSKPAVERHPERRMKATYAAFEERELPRLKDENPNLRMSQLKQLVRKQWMKSPENPMNQIHTSYNEKS